MGVRVKSRVMWMRTNGNTIAEIADRKGNGEKAGKLVLTGSKSSSDIAWAVGCNASFNLATSTL